MRIETLIATMDQTDHALLQRMRVETEAVVVNQCDRFQYESFENGGKTVRFYSLPERGVGLSRNFALMHASADICVFSDDDLEYRRGYSDLLLRAFESCPKADVIVFNLGVKESRRRRRAIHRRARVRWYSYMRYGSARIAVRREAVLKKNLSFPLLFGGGARFGAGEDTVFLHDCLKKGLRIYALPVLLAETDDSTSTWFSGYNEQFFRDKGALMAAIYDRWGLLFGLGLILKNRDFFSEGISFRRGVSLLREGMHDFYRREASL